MNHPLNNRGWSQVRDQLCTVLSLAARYLELKIKQMEGENEKESK